MILDLQDHPRYLVVQYEDLVIKPDDVQERIGRHFPFLNQTCRFSQFPEGATVHELAQESLNGLRGVDRASLDKWREHLPRIKGELERHPSMVEWLIKMGYEKDDSWTGVLDSVEPWFGDYKNERPHLGRRIETAVRYRWQTHTYLRRRNVTSA